MKLNWTRVDKESDTHYFIDIRSSDEHVVAREYTGHWKAEIGGAISWDEFLNGKWDELITEKHGVDVLNEVKESLKEFKKS